MSAEPVLTVAIPTYNGARHLPEALRSILAQEDVDFELVISDDRSEDETLDLVRAIAGDRARISVNPERLGLAGNWNRCVELSRTDWVAIFHQDDVMLPGHLEAHNEQIARFLRPGTLGDLEWGMICGAAEAIDDRGDPVQSTIVACGSLDSIPANVSFVPGDFVRELAVSNPIRCSTVMLSKAAHVAIGGFDPSYRYAVDWDFWLRLARRYAVRWLARPTVAFRWHPASATHTFQRGTIDLDEQAELLDRLFESEAARWPDARRLRRLADHRLARAYLNRAYGASKAGDHALARSSLRRSVQLRPGILGTIAIDPKLALRLAGSLVGTAGRGSG